MWVRSQTAAYVNRRTLAWMAYSSTSNQSLRRYRSRERMSFAAFGLEGKKPRSRVIRAFTDDANKKNSEMEGKEQTMGSMGSIYSAAP